MSRNRIIFEQRWQSVVRAPSASSCAVRPEIRASGEGSKGSPSWGTSRWQNWQRMILPGQIDVRWTARSFKFVPS